MPLLEQQQAELESRAAPGSPPSPPAAAAQAAAAAAAEEGVPLPSPRSVSFQEALRTPPQHLLALGESLWKQRSLPPLVAYSSLEPYESPFLSSEHVGCALPAGLCLLRCACCAFHPCLHSIVCSAGCVAAA